jgi:hypothetical protein
VEGARTHCIGRSAGRHGVCKTSRGGKQMCATRCWGRQGRSLAVRWRAMGSESAIRTGRTGVTVVEAFNYHIFDSGQQFGVVRIRGFGEA